MNNVDIGSLKARAIRRQADSPQNSPPTTPRSPALTPRPVIASLNHTLPASTSKFKPSTTPKGRIAFGAWSSMSNWWGLRSDQERISDASQPHSLIEISKGKEKVDTNDMPIHEERVPTNGESETKALLSSVPPTSAAVIHISTSNAPVANEFFSVLFGILVWKLASYGGTVWTHKLMSDTHTHSPLLIASLELTVTFVLSYVLLNLRTARLGSVQPLTSMTQLGNLAAIIGLTLLHTLVSHFATMQFPPDRLPGNRFSLRENQLVLVAVTLAVFTMRMEAMGTYFPLIPLMVAEGVESLVHMTISPSHFAISAFLSSMNVLRMVLVWHVMTTDKEMKLTPINVLVYTAPMEAALIMIASLLVEPNLQETWASFLDIEFTVLMVGVMVFSFSMRLANKYLLRLLNPLSHTVLSEGQLVFYVLISIAFGWIPLTAAKIVAMVFKMVCCAFYARARVATV